MLLLGSLASASPAAARTERIVGGHAAAGATWPWLARIRIDTAKADYYCSGTVVSPTVVLTAGHCVVDAVAHTLWPRSDYTVMTGSTSTAGGQTSAVSQVDLYTSYLTIGDANGDALPDHDLALLQLSAPTSAPAITLASPAADAALYQNGTSAQIAGWGETTGGSDTLPSTLQVADTVVQSQSFCGAQSNGRFGVGYDSSSEICAMDSPTNTAGACNGDSGGPLVAAEPGGTLVEIGITSWVAAGCSTSMPDFFTDVAAFSSWLAPQIAQLTPTYPSSSGSPAGGQPGEAASTSPGAKPAAQTTAQALPEWGLYRGGGHQVPKISFRVAKSGRLVKNVALGFTVSCTAHRGRVQMHFRPASSFSLDTHRGLGLSAGFLGQRGWRYALSVLLTRKGHASGTLRVTGHRAGYGSCNSGLLRWTAS